MQKFLFFLVLFITIFVFVFPVIYAYKNTPPNLIFSGQASYYDPWDVNVHNSVIRASRDQGMFIQNPYTSLPTEKTLIYPFYTFLGVVFKNIDPNLLNNLSIIVVAAFLTLTIYKIAKILKIGKYAVIAPILVILGGGFGLLIPANFLPPDVFISPFTFSTAFNKPHEIFAITLYTISLISTFLFINKKVIKKKEKIIYLMVIVLSILLTSITYPYLALSFYLIIGIYSFSIFRANRDYSVFLKLVNIVIYTLPFILIYGFYLSSGGFESLVFQQNTPPNLLLTMLGFGVLTPILLYQMIKRNKSNEIIFLNTWIIVHLVLAYSGISFGKFYFRGLFLPLVLSALLFLNNMKKSVLPLKNFIKLTFLLIPITGIFLFMGRLSSIKPDNNWIYLTRQEKEIFEFILKNTPKGSGILGDYLIANKIPAYTDAKVFFGHNVLTPNADKKIIVQQLLLSEGLSENDAQKLLVEQNVSYVLWDGEGQTKYQFLKEVFRNSGFILYSTSKSNE